MGSGGDTTERRAIGPEDSPLVAFARECDYKSKRATFHFSLDWRDVLPWLGYALAYALLYVPPVGIWFLPAIVCVWALCLWIPRQRHRDVPIIWGACLRAPGGGSRVACVGSSWRLKRFSAQGPIVDEFHEPYACLVPFALRVSKTAIGLSVVAACAGVFLLKAVLEWKRADFGWMVFPGMAAGWLVAATIMPTYVRLAPGRLEVLERGLLGRRLIARTVFDLRTSKVVVDLNRSTVFLIDAHGKVCELVLRAAANKDALAAAILRAAISTHMPPPLPEDELVG